jgi:5-methylcytosine-specific restriction endonuclease McrA
MPAKIVDHIKEIKDGGDRLSLENLQSMCIPCHNIKTAKEKQHRGGAVKSLQTNATNTEPPHICLDKLFLGGTLG